MKKEFFITLLLIGGILCMLACRLTVPPYQKGDVIINDHFIENENNWDVWFEDGVSAASIVDGELVMIVEKPNIDVVSTNSIAYPDIEMQAIANKKFGSNDNIYGFVCRYLNEANYYSFLISSDGYYGIAKMLKGEYSLLSSRTMEYSESIMKGNAENILLAVCSGNTLSFSVNGSILATVSDKDLTAGRNGFIVGSFEDPGEIVIAFDESSIRAH